MQRRFPGRRRVNVLAIAAATAALAIGFTGGCAEREEIVSYQAPKVETSLSSEGRDGMLAAMILHEDFAWFFKLTGPEGEIDLQADSFEKLVRSVRFSGGRPDWDLPADWRRKPGSSAMRFASIQVPSGKRLLDLSVIKLPGPQESERESYTLQNVNRWRGQLGLEEIAAGELDSQSQQFEVGQNPAVLVKLAGKLSDNAMGGQMMGGTMSGGAVGPFAGGAAGPNAGGEPDAMEDSPNPPPNRPSPIKYATPEGWRPSRGTSMSLAAVEAIDGAARIETTITPAGGDLLANVNRWRGQIGLAPFSAQDMASQLEKIELAGGVSGDYVRLVGADQSIYGVVAASGGRTWFIKLSGDAKLADKERANFEAFVRSIELPK